MTCIAADPACPCQDGGPCHYTGTNAWPVPETILWHHAESTKPDAEITVLLAFDPALGLDVELGFYDGERWHCAEYLDEPVPKWWADVPAGPQA